MLKYYCNEDVFLMQVNDSGSIPARRILTVLNFQVMVTEGIGEDSLVYDITLVETQWRLHTKTYLNMQFFAKKVFF